MNEPREHQETTQQVTGMRRAIYLVFAGLFFALGALGVILPVLPTTPFLLLCSYFLVRSFPQLNKRLLESRLFGPILVDWQQKGGVRRSVKVKAILVAVTAVAISLSVSSVNQWVRWAILGLVTVGILVIYRLPEVVEP